MEFDEATGGFAEHSTSESSYAPDASSSGSDTEKEPPPRPPPADPLPRNDDDKGRRREARTFKLATVYQFPDSQPGGIGRGWSTVVRLNDPPAKGTVIGLDRENQAVDSQRKSRQGNDTCSPRMMGDYTVNTSLTDHKAGGTDLDLRKLSKYEARCAGPNIQIYPEAFIVDRIRETNFTASGRKLSWTLLADHCTFPREGVLTFSPDFASFEGVVTYGGNRKEWWTGTRCRYFGKRHPYGVFPQGLQGENVSIEPDAARLLPFPPVNGQFASLPDARPQAPVRAEPRTLTDITALFCHAAINKILHHRQQSLKVARALHDAWWALQIGTGTRAAPQYGPDDPQPLNLKDPGLAAILAERPEWIVLTPADQLEGTRGIHWNLSALAEDGTGTITEIVPGPTVPQFLNVAGIREHADRLLFKDRSAISQHASDLGSDDHCSTWRHPLPGHTGSTLHPLPADAVDTRDWVTSLADHHDGFYEYAGMMFQTFEEDVTESYWNEPSPWPQTVPFAFVPGNTVIKQKPPNPTTGAPGKKKIRRSANFRFPWTKKRQLLFLRTGIRPPLAYNDDTALPAKPSGGKFVGRSSGRPFAGPRQVHRKDRWNRDEGGYEADDDTVPSAQLGPCEVPLGRPDPPVVTSDGSPTWAGTSAWRDSERSSEGSTYNSSAGKAWRTARADTDATPRLDMLTRWDLGQIIVILWSMGLRIGIHAADMRHFFRQFATALERRGLSGAFIRTAKGKYGYSTAKSLDYGATDNPLKTSRAGDLITQFVDDEMSDAAARVDWDPAVVAAIELRTRLLGAFHARYAKAGVFVDDIFSLFLDDADGVMKTASRQVLVESITDELGYKAEITKLQDIGSIAEYIGLSLRVDTCWAPGLNLPDWKQTVYVAQLAQFQDDDHKYISLVETEQVAGRMVHASYVWPEILLLLGPIYLMQASAPVHWNNSMRRRSAAAKDAFRRCEAILRLNELRHFFPPVAKRLIGDPHLGVGFTDVSRPGSDGKMDTHGHFVGMWCPLPDGRVLYGWVELTKEELELPVSTLEFVGSLWGMQAFWPHLRTFTGVVEYRAVTDSLAACLKSVNSGSIESSMEMAHRQFDITARNLQVQASLDFWYREDNELSDLLSHGPVALRPFLDLLRYEGFDADRAVRVDLAPISRSIEHLLFQLVRDKAKGRHSLGGAAYTATKARARV